MDKKCSKYEGLFVFSDEKTFNEHIKTCEECRREHEKMQKVSELIKEVKPYYSSKRNNFRKLKSICAAILLVVASTMFCVLYADSDLADSLLYGDTLSAEQLGFPVDSYGILMVDE